MCHNSKWPQSSFNSFKLAWGIHATLFGATSNSAKFKQMGLSEVEFCSTQKHGEICFFNQTGSLYFILVNFLISSVNILLRSETRKKKPEMGNFHVSKLLFLRAQILSVHLFALPYQIP